MTAVWKDIDPNYAESVLRGLNRRLTDLDGALRAQNEMFRAAPESFALALGNRSLLGMQEKLRDERAELLRHRVAEKLNIALDGGKFQNNTASIGALGALLIRIQKLYSSIGQSITQGPRQRGPIATSITEATELRLTSTFPSSFGMSLVVSPKNELFVDSLPGAAFESLFGLLSSTQSEREVMRLSGELGTRSINHLRHIANILSKQDSELSLEWSDSAGIKHYWTASPEESSRTLFRLSAIKETRAETKLFTGRIVGASLLRNRFELVTGDGAIIEGKIVSSTVEDVARAFGNICSVLVDETEITDSASGQSRIYYSLISIQG